MGTDVFDILMNIIFVDIYYICMIHQVGWDRTGWEAFKYMLCDPQKGTILTRCDTNTNANTNTNTNANSIFFLLLKQGDDSHKIKRK